MFELILGSLLLGLILIILINLTSSPVPRMEEQRRDEIPEHFLNLDRTRFEALCVRLLRHMGLEVKRVLPTGENELDIVAANPQPIIGGDYIVHCLLNPDSGVVGAIRVQSLSDTVRGERASKGIFITTGFFAKEVASLLELSPVELIDGPELTRLLDRYRIS